MIVRTSSQGAGRIVRVTLAQIDHSYRLLVSRRLRERMWDRELGPGALLPPTPRDRAMTLLEAVQIEAAANRPSKRGYYVPADVAEDAIRKHGRPSSDA